MMFKSFVVGDWPKYATRLIVLVACTTAVIFQMSECIMKLIHPPVSSHTELDITDVMIYPAITICRNPPYRSRVLEKYGLGTDIRYTSEWVNFPFNSTTLSEFWEEATYDFKNASILAIGLDGNETNIKVTSANYFLQGKCHTLIPLVTTDRVGSSAGYSIRLRNTGRTQQPWNLYVHQPNDMWSENTAQSTGLQELTLIRVGEEVRAKLSTNKLERLNRHKVACNDHRGYSATTCQERCRWYEISALAGCSVPWMPGTGFPECNNYESLLIIIKEYLQFKSSKSCKNKCLVPCYASHFSPFIVFRGSVANLSLPYTDSMVFIFHASKLVTTVQEIYDYNLSRFVADAGGTLGFLLGLSVLSLVSLIGKAIRILTSCSCQNNDTDEIESITSKDSSLDDNDKKF